MKLEQTIIEIYWEFETPFEDDLKEKMFKWGFIRDRQPSRDAPDLWVRKTPSRPRYWLWLDKIATQYQAEKVFIKFECEFLNSKAL